LRDRLVDLLATDEADDRFLFEVGPPQALDVGFRFSVTATWPACGRQLSNRVIELGCSPSASRSGFAAFEPFQCLGLVHERGNGQLG
jgi:hypothetical protein